ncbi:hypothetical protein GCWU000282_01549 [Catonella morbi ATCC 51271]|jgi:hypothetical protein|uniref:DUF1836 domain-containing protein n=1 Tax=Catonella morbi ATCC 51271 TaxID=592026 RepID=V2XKK4_9FIRM|nr:DUF1836 domain-containing protein [Catonella morbi]ESL02679.1 hypothetical protein GCWU000282_01549 [Catonella morbi ATCC 51271]
MNKNDKKEFVEEVANRIRSLDYIKIEDIPGIELYMDQVIKFMDDHFASLKRYEGDKMLTKTMINNYTKNKLLPSPEKKKYGKDHMLLLIFIYYFKNVLSIKDINSILTPLTENFFADSDKDFSLSDIYDEVFEVCKSATADISRSVLKAFDRAKNSFEGEDDEKKKKYLNNFAFIASLCFDVHVKKTIVENMIDNGLLDFKDDTGKESRKK